MFRSACLCCALVLSVLLAGQVAADDISAEAARELRRAGRIQALDSLIARVQERHPGARLLEAELEYDDGLYIYELEIVTSYGEVRELEVDAASGRILEDEAED